MKSRRRSNVVPDSSEVECSDIPVKRFSLNVCEGSEMLSTDSEFEISKRNSISHKPQTNQVSVLLLIGTISLLL